jgi:hypothetical protein
MVYNEYIRNEWQPLSIQVLGDVPVTIDSVNSWGLTETGYMKVQLAYKMSLANASEDLLRVVVELDAPTSPYPVRVSTIVPHTSTLGGDDTLYSNVMFEYINKTLTCTGFPLSHSRCYDVNLQFCYRL